MLGPEGLILDTQYDWRALYGDNLQRVGGFSKSVNNDILARGYLFERDENGLVTMKIKGSTSEKEWQGVNNQLNGPGWHMLSRMPTTPPVEVPPDACTMLKDELTALGGEAMRNACKSEHKETNLEWVTVHDMVGWRAWDGPQISIERRLDPTWKIDRCGVQRRGSVSLLRTWISTSSGEHSMHPT